MLAGAPTLILPGISPANLSILNGAELQKRGLLTDAARFAVDGFLWDNPPNGGILSERSYRFWSTAGFNAAAYYKDARGTEGPIDPDAVDRIALQLGFMQPSDRRGLDYLATVVSHVITSGAMAATGRPEVEARLLTEVFPLQPPALWALCDPWHAKLAAYVIRQDRFEKSPLPGKATEQRRIQFLLQLYAWYVNLAGEVSLPLDRPTVYGILQHLFPAGWKRKPFEIASQYTRYLAQMIAIEQAVGAEAPRITGYVQRGLPLLRMENFLGSAEAKDRWPKVSRKHLDPLLEVFGRYFYLTPFSTKSDERRLRGVLRGAQHFLYLPEESRAGFRSLFLGLQIFLSDQEGPWAVHTPNPRQVKGPFWSYRTAQDQILAIGEARTAKELDGIEGAHSAFADGVVGQTVTALLEQKLISPETLFAIHQFLHRRPPVGDVLQESSYRFWLAFFANLAVSYISAFGTDAPLNIQAVAELTRKLIDEAEEDDLPSLHYVLQGLREILKPPTAVEAFDLPQIGSRGLLPFEAVASPHVVRLAHYVVEQDGFESGTGFVPAMADSMELLVRLHDWYFSYMDEEEIHPDRIPIQHKLAHGIVRRLNPLGWEQKPYWTAMYSTRKLRQLLALTRRLPENALTGYTERTIPIPLINEFVSQGHAAKPDLPENPGTMQRLLADLFGRFYYLKNFKSPSADFPQPRAMKRLKKIIAGFTARGEVAADAAKSLEAVFLSLHQYLLRREEEWMDWSKLKRDAASYAKEESPPAKTFDNKPFSGLSARDMEWRGKAVKGKGPKQRRSKLKLVQTLSEMRDENYYALLEEWVDAAWSVPLPEEVRKIPVDAAGYREYVAGRAASATISKAAEPTTAPAAAKPQRASFQVPSWIAAGWTEGKGGILNRNTLIDAGLLTRRVADLYYQLLSDKGVPPHRLGGVFAIVMNIYCAYRALGGGIGRVDTALLEKVAINFTRHGSRASADYRAQGRRRAGYVLDVIGLITETHAKEGHDVSRPLASLSDQPIPLLKLSGEEETVLEKLPEKWSEGVWGFLSIPALMRLGSMDPRTIDYCWGQIEKTGMTSPKRREECLAILCNILAAYARKQGWSWSFRSDKTVLNEVARNFVILGAQSVSNLSLEDFQEFARLTLEWRNAQEGGLYPRLELEPLRQHFGEVFPVAEAVAAQEAELSASKRERLTMTLLNIFYYYEQCGGSLQHFDVPLANAIISEFVSRNDLDLIRRYQKRLQSLAQQLHKKQIETSITSIQTSKRALMETLAAESGENWDIPGVPPHVAKAFAEWGLAEVASEGMIGMMSDPHQRLRDLISKWRRDYLLAEEAVTPLFNKILEIREWLHLRQLVPDWHFPQVQREIPEVWFRGEITLDLGFLRTNGLISIPAQLEIGNLLEEQSVPEGKRPARLELLGNLLALYFARNGTLWVMDEPLLEELSQAYAILAKVPDPKGYARYLEKSIRKLLEQLRTITPQQPRTTRIKWQEVPLLREQVLRAPVQEPQSPEPAPLPQQPPPRKAKVSDAILIAAQPADSLPHGMIPDFWRRRESFLTPQQLMTIGLLSSQAAKTCDDFLTQRRKLGRGERITHQFVLYNLLAAYALETGANTRQMDSSILERIVDDFAEHSGTANLPDKKGYYFETLKQLFDYFRTER